MSFAKSLRRTVIRTGTPVVILACGVGAFLVFGQRPEIPKKEIEKDKSVRVETVALQEFQGQMTIDAEGVAVPYRQISVSAEVGGRITYKSPECRSGNYVPAQKAFGPKEVPRDRPSDLFRIDTTDYKFEVARLEAQLKQANEELAMAAVDISSTQKLIVIAEKTKELRARELERDLRIARQNSLTERQVNDSRHNELAARNQWQTLKNQKAQLEQKRKTLAAARDLVQAQLDRAEADLARTRVGAPIAGTIVADFFEQGDYVKKGDPLFKLNDTSRAEVKCNLRVEEIYWVWLQSGRFSPDQMYRASSDRFELPSTPVEVVFPFGGVEYVWDGRLSRYEAGGLDNATRTVPCRVLIEEPTKVRIGKRSQAAPHVVPPMLFSGLYVKLRIPIRPPMPLYEIPTAAFRPGNEIWVADKGRLKVVKVRVARTTPDGVLIFPPDDGSVPPGSAVIVSPMASAENGMRVKQVEQK